MTTTSKLPDALGHFGEFGGKYVPETLMPALSELEEEFRRAWADEAYRAELDALLRDYVGRATPITAVPRLAERYGGAGAPTVYLKREDLAHTGAHKINAALGQALLAKRMGKPRIVAETGAGQHGVATATVCALMDLECVVYMGAEDVRRQALNVFRMKLLGAEVRTVETGSRTLKDAINEAIRDWVTNVRTTHYLLGSVVGPHPYPLMVRELQAVIGDEAREQIEAAEGRLPSVLVACVGGGSNAIGLFNAFMDDDVRLIGVEAAGEGMHGKHAAPLAAGRPGVLHGARSYLLQDDAGQVLEAHSISAGLGREYRTSDPSVGILDFLSTDSEGNYVVIETKRDVPDRQAVGQILGYMGWVEQKLCPDDRSVRGVLIAGDASDGLRMAVSAVPNLDLRIYEITFALKSP